MKTFISNLKHLFTHDIRDLRAHIIKVDADADLGIKLLEARTDTLLNRLGALENWVKDADVQINIGAKLKKDKK